MEGNGDSAPPPPSRLGGIKRFFGRGEPPQPRPNLGEAAQPSPIAPTSEPAPSQVIVQPVETPTPAKVENGNGNGIEGVATDQKLLQYFYRLKGVDTHAIATDRFLDKSRDEYNAAWLTRELVQNFVDHNPQHPGTLDGVRFTQEPLQNDGMRFRIEGDWPFEDPTGVLSPHSDKPEDMNTAGGNGIGLKQTAIRFMRDFGVQRFEIDGEGWSTNYRLAKAEDVNREWETIPGQVPIHKVKHDWLLADINETPKTGKNAYIIETSNPDVMKALQQLPTLGVSSENPYLQNMDYQNKFGGIKWLPKGEGLEPTRGRLFINGQVMNYKDKGATAEDYWVGPESATIQLNNVKYKMSVDRPPVNPYELGRYLDDMVQAMTKDDMVEQLKRSEHLWAGHVDSTYGTDRQGAFVVVEKLARTLPYKGYDRREWQQHFAGKNYIAWDRGVSESQVRELEKQGFIVCPGYMEQVGMSSASSKLSTVEAASNEVPQIPQHKREQFAQEYGMEVACEEFPNVKDPSEFIGLISKRLSGEVIAIEGSEGNPNVIRLMLRGDMLKELLFHTLPRPKEDDQKLVYLLRGMAAYGLGNGMFKKIFTSQGDFVTTFGLDYDFLTKESTLLARNIQNKSDKGVFVELELDDKYLQEFQDAFRKATETRTNGQPGEVLSGGFSTPTGELTASPAEDSNRPATGVDINRAIEVKAWTADQEQLYQAAIRKNPTELSEQEKLIIQQREHLKQEFGSVPVAQPEAPDIERKGNVIKKEATMSDAEKARVSQMEAQLPGILEAVNKLEELVPEPTIAEPTGQSSIEKYLQWRQSDKFYGQLGDNAGYLTGRHLIELVEGQNQADIATVGIIREETPEDRILGALQSKLKGIVDRMNPAEDEVDDFEIVLEPTEKQLAQLGLLRLYTQLATDVAIPNDLFVYKGTGSKGINLGQKAIGMHESLFDVKFTEAMRTFIHEVAHNYPEAEDHGNMFRHAMESLFTTTIDRVTQIATKLETGGTAIPEERVILDMQREWDKIKTS